MKRVIASAIYHDRVQAERAISDLRAAGIADKYISLVHKHADGTVHDDKHHHDPDTKASGAGKGAAVGAGVGAIAGLAALAIPGVGPFVAFGALAEVLGVAGSAAVTSGIVGSAAGGLSGALMNYGVDKDEAEYYSRGVEEGGYWVAVEASDNVPLDRMGIEQVLRAGGGRTATTGAPLGTGTGIGTDPTGLRR